MEKTSTVEQEPRHDSTTLPISEDTARLDWLSKGWKAIYIYADNSADIEMEDMFIGTTLRVAIDAARKQSPDKTNSPRISVSNQDRL